MPTSPLPIPLLGFLKWLECLEVGFREVVGGLVSPTRFMESCEMQARLSAFGYFPCVHMLHSEILSESTWFQCHFGPSPHDWRTLIHFNVVLTVFNIDHISQGVCKTVRTKFWCINVLLTNADRSTNIFFEEKKMVHKCTSPPGGGEGWPMRGRDLIMWSEGQGEAASSPGTSFAPLGESHRNGTTDRHRNY